MTPTQTKTALQIVVELAAKKSTGEAEFLAAWDDAVKELQKSGVSNRDANTQVYLACCRGEA